MAFFKKTSLDWPLTLTTQPSTSKLPDNPVSCECKEANWRMCVLEKTGLLRVGGGGGGVERRWGGV